MIGKSALLLSTMCFSYGQFLVFDHSVALPGCAWTEVHFRQGFARRERNVCFGTLLEFGHAELAVYLGPCESQDDYERVVEVPIEVSSGQVGIQGPEEVGSQRFVELKKGHYRLVAAQVVTDEEQEAIAIFFELLAKPITCSQVLVADDALDPPATLIESVEIA